VITPTLILPHQGGGEFFRELDAPQLCCGVLHSVTVKEKDEWVIPSLYDSQELKWMLLMVVSTQWVL
jgi:hypothetical protein